MLQGFCLPAFRVKMTQHKCAILNPRRKGRPSEICIQGSDTQHLSKLRGAWGGGKSLCARTRCFCVLLRIMAPALCQQPQPVKLRVFGVR